MDRNRDPRRSHGPSGIAFWQRASRLHQIRREDRLLRAGQFRRSARDVELASRRNEQTGHGNDKKFAGIHGEGFKVGALVMRRSGYAVPISASSYYWNFGFNGTFRDRFYCRLSRPAERTLERETASFSNLNNTTEPPCKDKTKIVSSPRCAGKNFQSQGQ